MRSRTKRVRSNANHLQCVCVTLLLYAQAKLELTICDAEKKLMEELGLGSNAGKSKDTTHEVKAGNTAVAAAAAGAGAGAAAGAASTSAGNAYVYLGAPTREELEQAALKPDQVMREGARSYFQLCS